MKKKLIAAIAAEAMPRDEIAQIQVKKAKDFKFWNSDAAAKQKLIEYVSEVTDKKSKNYIPVEDRLAVFDMDGTFICETAPCYFEWMLYLERALHDPDYTPTLEDKAYAEMVNAE